jgi:hypothetical protein
VSEVKIRLIWIIFQIESHGEYGRFGDQTGRLVRQIFPLERSFTRTGNKTLLYCMILPELWATCNQEV